ncbi:MAG: 4-alpha-glucanotransferase, partial [Chloroflexi bacterium]|nr:4-alpha-glucanotransferase [Chloroflexota bacterium]
SGILCHPTSFPGPYGIGDLGRGALSFLEFIHAAGQSAWQILPLGPTGYGDSPYQPFSAFAGNPLLIDPEQLVEGNLLSQDDLSDRPGGDPTRVDYGGVIGYKRALLSRAFERLVDAPGWLHQDLQTFRHENGDWLEDYALFMALKEHLGWASWPEWEEPLVQREASALALWRDRLRSTVDYHCFVQYLFDAQWQRVHRYAAERGISIIGDMPIFVGHDSADAWANQHLFFLDQAGQPTVVAGVPPDYFSPTGQRWGNPLYRWDLMAQDGYKWWMRRMARVLTLVDEVRIDHFRGFVNYWEVQAQEPTAINGRWLRGPGRAFFDALAASLGKLPIIAEDLGMITPDVTALRQELGLPGMAVLQFAFDGEPANPHMPYNYVTNSVVYTGTHDNDTTRGWYESLGEGEAHRVRLYTGSSGADMPWPLIRLALGSVADLAVIPMQDILSCGSAARMNWPGQAQANWTWRFTGEALDENLASTLRALTELAGRAS